MDLANAGAGHTILGGLEQLSQNQATPSFTGLDNN